MKRKFFILIILLILAIIQSSALPKFFPENSVPNLLLIVVIVWSAKIGFSRGWKLAVVSGFLSDLFSFVAVGTGIFYFTAAAICVSYLARRFLVSQKTLQFFILLVFVFCGSLLEGLLRLIFPEIFRQITLSGIFSLPLFSSALIFKVFYDSLLFSLLYWPIKRVEKFLNFYPRTDLGISIK